MRFNKKIILILILAAFFSVAVLGFLYLKFKMPKMPKPNKGDTAVMTGFSYPFEPNTIFVDFEDFEPGDNICDKNAYSGTQSFVVEGKNSFSTIIKKPVADIGLDFMRRAGVSAHIYVYPQNIEQLNAHLVFSVTDESGNNVFWGSVGVSHKFIEPEKWIKISGAFDLEGHNITNAHTVNVYLWNDSKTKILIDDIFVVLGKDPVITGDTIYCVARINGEGLPPHNHPPFKIRYLEKEKFDDNALNKLLLVQKNSPFTNLNEAIAVGKFFNASDGLDKIIFKSDEKLQALAYCEAQKKFEIFTVDANPQIIEAWDKSKKLSARFEGLQKEGIVIADTVGKEIYFLTMTPEQVSCISKRIIKTEMYRFPMSDLSQNNSLPVDFFVAALKDGITGLIAVYADNTHTVFNLRNSRWIKDDTKPKAALADIKDNKGHFLIKQKGKADVLLKYHRNHGFDMHLLSLNDASPTVLNKIDFKGYEKDYNPKFYEVVSIMAGCFVHKEYTSLIVICTNCMDKNHNGIYCTEYINDDNLPDAVHLFSFR